MKRTIKQLESILGSLSKPSKMPGFAWGFSASECILGSVLARQKGTVCSGCYAKRGMYTFPSVRAAHAKRLEAYRTLGADWGPAIAELIRLKYRKRSGADRVFRWLDSGDLQSADMLHRFADVAELLPDIRFWLPTRETGIVREYLGSGRTIPGNLLVRVSANRIGEAGPARVTGYASSVSGPGFPCPARPQGNECGNCRACWHPSVRAVSYERH